jgi:membrane protein required for colicin V production
MSLALVDWILLGVLLASLVLGFWRGLVYEVLSLAGWLAAFIVAQWLALDAVPWLPFLQSAAPQIQYAVAFAAVFVATLFAAGLVSWLIKKLVDTVGLRPIDRSLGAVFGLARGLILLLAFSVLLKLFGMGEQSWWTEGQGPAWLAVLLKGIQPLLPQVLLDYLP